jgi:hypothetical protein
MPPIDPVTLATASPLSATAPPYVNEEPNLTMVQQGLDLAEDETREAVTDAYEEGALLSDDPQESLDDIDYDGGGEEPGPPELTAIHEAFVGNEEEE